MEEKERLARTTMLHMLQDVTLKELAFLAFTWTAVKGPALIGGMSNTNLGAKVLSR